MPEHPLQQPGVLREHRVDLHGLRRGRTRSDHGSTLVEVLISVAIMGTAVVAIVGGMNSLFASSGQSRQATTAGIVARDYAEALQLAAAGGSTSRAAS